MNASMILSFDRDINDPLITFCPATLLARGDRNANIIKLTVMDGNAPADLSGNTAVVLFQRPGDSYVVRCPGSVSGNVISVTLLGDCYLYAGQYYASLILNADGFARTMLRLAGHIESNGDGPIIDPTGTIPGYEDIARIYAELEASLGRSDAATDSANAAAQNANEKAALASEAAGNANAAADSADEATIRANEASESIEGLTVEASDVSYDQPATATVTDVDGHKRIAFGLRQGVPGPVPTLTFTAKTGEPGTDVVAEQSGTPEAPVVGLTIPRGDPGEGAVSTVDGLMPVSGGNVELSAVRYVAQTLEDEQKVQARKNIGVDGQVYPCTAQSLEEMSQEQQAEIYAQGYRAIKTENNGTVVLLGLAEDGSLEWLGCNQSRGSCLDNGNFAIAQAGHGGMHGTTVYAADRWIGASGWTYSVENGVISASTETASGAGLEQRFVAPFSGPATAVVTINPDNGANWAINIYDITNGSVSLGTATGQAGEIAIVNFTATAGHTILLIPYFATGSAPKSGTITQPAVYQGTYTPKTLPPWKEPDYVAELQKCQYFYGKDILNCWLPVHNPSLNAYALLVTYPKMRVAPTIELTASDGVIASVVYQSALMLYVTGVENPFVNGIKRIADL